VLAVQACGWLYAAGLMAAIAFVVVRASDSALSLGTVLMTVSLIRRSRAQLASAASGSGALVSTLTTADRLLWLQDHHAASVAAAGKEPAPARLRSGITVRGLSSPSRAATILRGHLLRGHHPARPPNLGGHHPVPSLLSSHRVSAAPRGQG
jgi:hypothetical protein